MKKIRLALEAYRQGYCFSVTVAVADRVALFDDVERAAIVIEALRETAAKYESEVFAYCLMPDHIHILVAPPEDVSLVEFVRLFKQLSAFRLKQFAGKPVAVWQQRFYDHALRSEEALEDVAHYIWNNPVRAGIVSDADAYPYSGSLVMEAARSGSEDTRPTVAVNDLRSGSEDARPTVAVNDLRSGSEDARPTVALNDLRSRSEDARPTVAVNDLRSGSEDARPTVALNDLRSGSEDARPTVALNDLRSGSEDARPTTMTM